MCYAHQKRVSVLAHHWCVRILVCIAHLNFYSVLSNPAEMEKISICHTSTDDAIGDLCAGEFVCNHLMFTQHHDALQFLLYYDDIEVCNALGAKQERTTGPGEASIHW